MPVILPETIVRRRCAALIPYARNARTHSDQQVAQIATSIREFGFTNPVLRAARIGGARAEREDPKLVGAFNGSRVISSNFMVCV